MSDIDFIKKLIHKVFVALHNGGYSKKELISVFKLLQGLTEAVQRMIVSGA